MGWLSARLPHGRDIAAAAIFGGGYFLALWFFRTHGWYPRDLKTFVLCGVFTIGVLLLRRQWPLATFLGVAFGYPVLFGGFLRVEFLVLPVLLAAYTVSARGRLRTVLVMVLALGSVTHMLLPLPELLSLLPTHGTYSFWWWNPSSIILVESLTVLSVLLGRSIYQHRQIAAQLMARNRELERLRSVETDQVVSAERTRIARELHDVVAHHVSAVVIRAQAADRVADTQPGETREAIRWIAANGQQTLAAMRQVVRVLRTADSSTALTPQTTLAELPQIAERMGAVGLRVDLEVPSVVPVLPSAVELATVRIIQEALTNVLVHANATRALVELRLNDDELRLDIHDNGTADSPPTAPIRKLAAAAKGRPPEQVLPPSASVLGGNGLIGMRERAASCGGNLSIGASPLGGWQVTATLNTNLPGGINGTRSGPAKNVGPLGRAPNAAPRVRTEPESPLQAARESA